MEESTTTSEPQGNKMNPMIIIGILALLVIGGAVFVMNQGKSDSTPAATESSETAAPTTSPTDATQEGEVITVAIEAGSFYFKPDEIRVKKGDKVKIVLTAKDMMHGFSIDELNVKMPITKAGETNTVEFTADTVGSFEYYCGVGSHRANGQVGTLIVE